MTGTPRDEDKRRRGQSTPDRDTNSLRHEFVFAQTHDPAEAESIVTSFYFPHRLDLQRRSDGLDMQFAGLRLGAISVGRLTYGRDLEVSSEALENFHVNIPLSGRALSASGPDERCLTGVGEAAVFVPGAPAKVRWSADCEQLWVMIGRRSLEAELEHSLGRSIVEPLQFAMHMNLSTPVAAWWRVALDMVAREFDQPSGMATHPAISKHLERLLLEGLLLAQPHNYSDTLGEPACASARKAVAQAVELLEERPSEPWSSTTLAREVHLSVRSLQEGFKRDVGQPPMTYLRDIRLRRVRTSLLRAAPGTTTVGAVATRHGFLHLGRFAATYRRKFGEMPSATLARWD